MPLPPNVLPETLVVSINEPRVATWLIVMLQQTYSRRWIAHPSTYCRQIGNTFPFGFQVDQDYHCDYLLISPGPVIDGATIRTADVGLRVYESVVARHGDVVTQYDPRRSPAWVQAAFAPTLVPWHGRRAACLIEVYTSSATFGAGTSVEFVVQPYSEA